MWDIIVYNRTLDGPWASLSCAILSSQELNTPCCVAVRSCGPAPLQPHGHKADCLEPAPFHASSQLSWQYSLLCCSAFMWPRSAAAPRPQGGLPGARPLPRLLSVSLWPRLCAALHWRLPHHLLREDGRTERSDDVGRETNCLQRCATQRACSRVLQKTWSSGRTVGWGRLCQFLWFLNIAETKMLHGPSFFYTCTVYSLFLLFLYYFICIVHCFYTLLLHMYVVYIFVICPCNYLHEYI